MLKVKGVNLLNMTTAVFKGQGHLPPLAWKYKHHPPSPDHPRFQTSLSLPMDKVPLSWRGDTGHSADLEELLFEGRSGCKAWRQRSKSLHYGKGFLSTLIQSRLEVRVWTQEPRNPF